MKKSLLALAVLGAFAGVAQAQTSVTLYGSFDAGLRRVDDVTGTGDARLTMGSTGTYNSNRLGFKGVEDLGGGLNAHFTLESGFNSGTGAFDTGSTLFNRTASVGLGGAWGSLDLGRQYTVYWRTVGAYDPFNYKYTGIIPLSANQAAGSRLNNDIQATLLFGPVTVRAEYALGEAAGATNAGSTKAVGAAFVAGPVNVGAAYTRRDASLPGTGAFGDSDNWTVGGAFATGPLRVAIGYANEELDPFGATAATERKSGWVGGSFNITPAMALTAAYYRFETEAAAEGKRDLAIIGATYALSKRTNFYADVDRNKFTGTAITTPGLDKQIGVSVGVNHVF